MVTFTRAIRQRLSRDECLRTSPATRDNQSSLKAHGPSLTEWTILKTTQTRSITLIQNRLKKAPTTTLEKETLTLLERRQTNRLQRSATMLFLAFQARLLATR